MTAPGFEKPRFDVGVDVEAHMQACHPGATTRGVFFTSVRDFVQKRLHTVPDALFDGVTRKRWVAFASYPLSEYMTFLVNAARLAYSDVPLAEGLRRVGWISYDSFAATMAGKVVLFALGEGLEQVLQAAPKAYAVSVPGSRITSTSGPDGDWLLEMRGVPSFPDCYHCGVLEGAVRAHGFEPTIHVRRHARISNLDFRLQWR